MEQWFNVGSQLRDNANWRSHSFFPVASVTQLFNRDITAIFIVALMGTYQQTHGQVLRFGGTEYIFRGILIISLKQTATL